MPLHSLVILSIGTWALLAWLRPWTFGANKSLEENRGPVDRLAGMATPMTYAPAVAPEAKSW